jgi:acyl-CoA thioester hydrolase
MSTGTYVHEARIRVRYAETDQMGVAYHANHLVWMEIGRVEYCRAIGIRYREMEEAEGILLAVVEVECRYLAPARYDDEVVIATRIGKLGSRGIEFDYELRLGTDSSPLARGHTKHLFCDRTLRRIRLPRSYLERFERGAAS